MTNIRPQNFEQLQTTRFDICIIGGGATGAGIALDAAARGYKVLLMERNDFGSGTSSKSTKLIHGGVRYLEQAFKKLSFGQYRMVKKALQERTILLKIAPHITRPLQLLTPCRSWLQGVYYFLGLKLYDFISGSSHIGNSEFLSRQKALKKISTLKARELLSAVVYYDAQLDDQRFNWALIQTAMAKGAICLNHLALHSFQKNEEGKISGASVLDTLTMVTYTVQSKVFVNATGPFSDNIRNMANEKLLPRMQVSKGVHIVLPREMMPSESALLIPKTKDGRLIFAIPYKNQVLVGTTDETTAITENDFGPTAQEVEYLLSYLNDYLEVQATSADILSGFGGLRPLLKNSGAQTKDLVRDHEVEYDKTSGLLSIMGGKWTTYRLMAKDTVDSAERLLGTKSACTTASIILIGSQSFNHHTAKLLTQQTCWDDDVVNHLIRTYGDQTLLFASIIASDVSLKKRLVPGLPYTYAELNYVLQHERVYTVKDVIAGRWGTSLASWQQALRLLPLVGEYMTQQLGWKKEEQEKYINDYQQELQKIINSSRV